jgi:nucleotide-binding universal stress UspA family protein
MKKILVPIDFSERSSEALDFAIEFNQKLKGKIILMHAIVIPTNTFISSGEIDLNHMQSFYQAEYIKGTHNRLEEWAERIGKAGQKYTTQLKYGHPFEKVTELITNEKVDWIVIGSNGASGIKEVFIGSLTERVIRHATCPVITIKGKSSLAKMKSMVFASTLIEDEDWMAMKAREIQELLDLNMHILKVKTPHNFLTEEVAKEQLKQFVKRNYLERCTQSTISADYSDQGIVAFAEEVNAGMILMGTHGKTGLGHIFGGSRAEDVANHSKTPVMTFKLPFD